MAFDTHKVFVDILLVENLLVYSKTIQPKYCKTYIIFFVLWYHFGIIFSLHLLVLYNNNEIPEQKSNHYNNNEIPEQRSKPIFSAN